MSWGIAVLVVAMAVVAGAFMVSRVPSGSPALSGGQPDPPRPVSPLSGTTGSSASSGTRDAPAEPASPPSSLGENWKLSFDAAFTGSRLNTSVWGTCYPWEAQDGCANYGNSNLEYQWYMPSQDQVKSGALHIVAQQAPTAGLTQNGSPESYSFRSGMVTTYPSYRFQYGYLQVVARVPTAKGLWSALWLAAANEQWPPEIDILEHWDAQPEFWQYYHPADAPREREEESAQNLSGWHTFGVYWGQSEVIWFLDGRPVMTTSRNVPQQPMYFIANVAVDGKTMTGMDSSMLIQSVKVWQRG